MRHLKQRLTFANVMSSIAVFVALGGSSYAAVKLSRNSVGATQIKTGAVRSSEVKDGALAAKDFKAVELLKLVGPKGATGATGATGPTGPAGPALTVVPVAIVATNTDGTLRNEAHRAPASGPVAPSRASAGIYDISVPGVSFASASDVATCTAGSANISVDVESIGGNTLRVFTFNAATGAAADAQLYCAIYENS